MKFSAEKVLQISLILFLFASFSNAQSGHSARNITSADGTILSVVARRTDDSTEPIKTENLYLYENGIEQRIQKFHLMIHRLRESSCLWIIHKLFLQLLMTLKKATMEFAYEIFDGDQLFVIAYDTKAEIIQEWTDDAKKIETSLGTFRKQGNSYLFDAIDVTVDEVLAASDARNAKNGNRRLSVTD